MTKNKIKQNSTDFESNGMMSKLVANYGPSIGTIRQLEQIRAHNILQQHFDQPHCTCQTSNDNHKLIIHTLSQAFLITSYPKL